MMYRDTGVERGLSDEFDLPELKGFHGVFQT
jgi:hypothetical protein